MANKYIKEGIDGFEHLFERVPFSGCWLWIGASDPDGYGRTARQNVGSHLVHRVIYKLAHGDIPDDHEIDHLCNVRCCVNPSHLEAVTKQENGRRTRGIPKKRKIDYATRTHCIRGHERTPESLSKSGDCKLCNRIAVAKYQAKRKQMEIEHG